VIVVTGGAGFIGSCVVSVLNQRGIKDLIIVDNLSNELKKKNIEGKKYSAYYDKKDFIALIRADKLKEKVHCVIHMGACSSTTLQDVKYFNENNYEYTMSLSEWSLRKGARFIYASSAATYGDGTAGYKDDDATIRKCKPLNQYGESKQKFDLWALNRGLLNKIVGLKFFNVFGPNEYHKGDMRSVVSKTYDRVASEGKMSLFRSYHPDYQDGEQKRDFIYVKDTVDVILNFMDHPNINGIFNVGTGQARTWNDLANALFFAVGKPAKIDYVEMPEILRGKYQYFTQAEMDKLKKSGYKKSFLSLEASVADYVQYLKTQRHM
jgi:ADP-L-glycero-D-manno-heptose 6-epimerase